MHREGARHGEIAKAQHDFGTRIGASDDAALAIRRDEGDRAMRDQLAENRLQ